MKCVVCHSEDVGLSNVKEAIKQGNNIIYVPVKVLMCNSCGEKYYDRKTMLYLEQTKTNIKHHHPAMKEIGKVLMLNVR